MAFQIFANEQHYQATDTLFRLKERLVAAATWTVISSSNGSSFGPGDNIASSTTMRASGSWMILQMATGSDKQLLFHGESGNSFNVWYCLTGGFSGTATAILPPTGSYVPDASKIVILGQSASFYSYPGAANRTGSCCIWVGGAAEDYSFFMLGKVSSSVANSAVASMFGFEKLETTSSLDQDPYVVHACFSNAASITDIFTLAGATIAWPTAISDSVPITDTLNLNRTVGWLRYGMTGSSFATMQKAMFGTISDSSRNLGAFDSYTTSSFLITPIYYGRYTNNGSTPHFSLFSGIKGKTKHLNAVSVSSSSFGTYSFDGTLASFGCVVFPWVSGTVWNP